MSRVQPHDILAGLVPTVFGVTIAQVNDVLGALSLVLGMAYLCWKWRREAQKGDK